MPGRSRRLILLLLFIGVSSLINTVSGAGVDRKSTRLNSSHTDISRMPSSA